MKFDLKYLFVILATLTVGFSSFATESEGGNHGGGGGDTSISAEFELIANAIGKNAGETYREDTETIFGVPPEELAATLIKVHVNVSLKPLYVGTHNVEALNFPATGLIQLYKPAWTSKKDLDKKVLLVIHEILGLLGLKDPLYTKSAEVFQKLKRNLYLNKIDSFDQILNVQAQSLIKKAVCSVYSKQTEKSTKYTLGHREGWRDDFFLSETLEEKYWLQVILSRGGTSIELYRQDETPYVKLIAKSDTSLQGSGLLFLSLETEYFSVRCEINPVKGRAEAQ